MPRILGCVPCYAPFRSIWGGAFGGAIAGKKKKKQQKNA
jgi:hypothetical protein